jgi:arylsulfatase A-like enzyme
VAAPQTSEPRHALRAFSLLGVLVVAKTTTLVLLGAGLDEPALRSAWAPVAYFWQDVLVALAFLLFDAATRTPRLAWTIYGLLAVYAAVNVPIAGTLSSPLTWTLLRATRGALADSIVHSITPRNLLGLALPIAAAVALPRWLSGRSLRLAPWVAVAAVIVALGPVAVSRVDTRGLHRNAVGALVSTSVPRLPPAEGNGDWRTSPLDPEAPTDDLSRLRASARERNVLLIVLESTAARYLGLYGARPDPMPTLTGLARNAIVFERAYAVYPESIKGLFATLCSRYPAFDTPPELYASAPCTSLAERLRSSGYRTALFHSGRFDYLGMRSMIDRRGFSTLEDAGAIGGNVHSSFGVDDASTVKRMLAWIDARETAAPFFATYLPVAGHHPYAASTAGPFEGTTDFPRYLNALHEGDAALADLVEGLRSRQLDRKTLFVIFGDHGEAFGQHPGNFAHTLFVYDENIRVPYMILAPGLLEEEIRVGRPASVIDTAPTVLDLLGLAVPQEYQGASLLEGRRRMALFYTDYSLGWLGLADGCWKYLFEIDQGRSTLFDVCTDPDETRDRARELPDRAAAYRAHVRRWASAQKEAIEPPPSSR